MTDDVSLRLEQFLAGDEAAVRDIWERYYADLIRVARRRLGECDRRMSDEEDVVLSAFQSFCRAAAAARFPRLEHRDDLWRLLVTITARKAAAQWKRQCAQKRGGGAVRGESALESPGQGNNSSSDAPHAAEVVPDRGPTPDMNILVAEECERLLDLLDDPLLQKVAVWKLEGYTNAEIAQKLGMAVVSVERKLARIRKLWEHREQTLPQA